jgi:hypothetical protein
MTRRAILLVLVFLVVGARPAWADLTAFFGATTTPESRMARGFAVGAGILVVGFEFEYSSTPDDVASLAPALKTYSGNVLLQTPVAVVGLQPYFTTGFGWFSEELDPREESGFASNIGGGVKISLAGPLRVRVDYRIFRLDDEARYSPVHRFYVGANLNF